jgi:DNA polymerase gamma 1
LEEAMRMEKIPKRPEKWAMNSGWTIYDEEGKSPKSIEFPNEKLLFFDVEVCVNDGKLPTMAVALSPTNWFIN